MKSAFAFVGCLSLSVCAPISPSMLGLNVGLISEKLPNPTPQTLEEALAPLPFRLEMRGDHLFGGTGTVTTQQLIEAAARAGVVLQAEEVMIKGAPNIPSRSAAEAGFRVSVDAPSMAESGGTYKYSIQLVNTTDRVRNFLFGADALQVVISKNGQPVRWSGGLFTFAIGYLLTCPPLKACQESPLSGQLQLDRFNAQLPLPIGEYDITFVLNGLGPFIQATSDERQDAFLLAQTTLTVLP